MAWQTMYPATPGSPYTTLASGIDDADTSISLTADPGFAAATNLACIWDDTGNFEVVRYTDLTGTTLTVERAFEGSARAWSAGAYIANLIPAYAINSLQNNVNELNTGKVPTTRTVNNKALSADISLTASDVGATPIISSLTEETAIADDDYIPIYDSSASVHRKMTRSNFLSGVVPDGGTTGQVLQKKSDADQDVEWGDGSGSSTAWGSITGTLSDQTDLGNVLDGKIAATDVTYENLNANGDVGTTSGTVCAGDDSRLSDSRTPTSHGNEAHSSTFLTEIAWGDITGTLSDQTDLGNVLDGKIAATDVTYENLNANGDVGTTSGTVCAGDDSRLSDSRTPTSHASSHVSTGSDPIATAVASGASGLMSGADKAKLDGIASGANNYSLPTASADTLGGVKIGDNLSIDGSGVLSAVASPYELPTASADTLGGVKVGSRLTITDGVLSADEQGGSYTLPTASADTLGGVKIGSGITITDGIISASGGGGGITWNEVTGTTQAAAADNGYIANNESLVTVTLPETCAVGKVVRVAGKGSGLWKIAQNESQIIYFGDQNTTSGTAGYLAAQTQYDSIELLCITANTTFNVISVVGNITVV